ncbi:hypothetical protein G4177_10560 [Corallococcus sp. ZKHCc1 1396]|uniref:DUF4184 family protein n=1 Tax=Corallococcus soli TaxID=2710757 RepID=A0ABR9PL37_9BACT|nr:MULTISPECIES: hypothetical protein [Corallococcus]MBE4748604.1 hypothetical protein [Corallococcus soli]MCY1031222.1 hypothetical protein [Corallococcus sp. BB11-1]
MTPLSPGVATSTEQDAPAAPGSLRFRRLWLFSPRADLAILAIPLALTLCAAGASAFMAPVAADGAHRLMSWTAQNILGNATHVVLTFLLFGVHRDVLTAAPGQPRNILAGTLAMLAVGAGFFFTFYADRSIHTFAVAVIFNVFGMHHTLSQHRGLWSLHGLRGGQEGLTPPSPLERRLQQLYVPLLLSILLVRIFFVAESAAPDAPAYLDVGQGTVLPWQMLPVLIALWLGYFLLLFRAVLRSGTASGPKVLYLLGMATATGLALVAPEWGYVMLPGMHGLEYYMLSARMLEPREGDAPRLGRGFIWPAMVLAMLPLLALGVVHGFLLDGPVRGSLSIGSGALSHPLLRGLTSLGFAVVLAHYFADAFIFRFRIPSIRQVMLRRLGLASPAPLPASAAR